MRSEFQTQEKADDHPSLPNAFLHSLRDERHSARRWQNLLSVSERHRMLAEIARVALAIGKDLYPASHLSDLDIGTDSAQYDVCPRERLAFLASAWPRLAGALRKIESAPATVLTPGVRDVRIAQGSLRRVSPSALLTAVRSGDFVSAPVSPGPLAHRLQGRLPRQIAETVTVPTADTPINRAVKGVLAQIARDLGSIASLAQTAEALEVARQAEMLREMVRRSLRREPWQSLIPLPVRDAYPAASHPAYRLIFDYWRRYRGSFAFDWANPLFTLPARETWILYEYSGLLAVADALRALGFRTASAEGFALARSGLTFDLAKGQASRLAFHKTGVTPVTLRYNPNFPRRTAENAEGWHSRSHALRPDITLEVDGRLLIFDAKFKTYAALDTGQDRWVFRDGNLLPDIQQMHTYRDAIVHGDAPNVVSGAWLLYAGRRDTENPKIVAYPASNGVHRFGSGEVGAVLHRPGGDPEPLQAFLHGFLNG